MLLGQISLNSPFYFGGLQHDMPLRSKHGMKWLKINMDSTEPQNPTLRGEDTFEDKLTRLQTQDRNDSGLY